METKNRRCVQAADVRCDWGLRHLLLKVLHNNQEFNQEFVIKTRTLERLEFPFSDLTPSPAPPPID